MERMLSKPWGAKRLAKLPSYLFAEIDRKKREAFERGRPVIDFGVGDPDRPTPGFIVDRMAEAIRDPSNHGYAPSVGMPALRAAFAEYFARRFGVRLNSGDGASPAGRDGREFAQAEACGSGAAHDPRGEVVVLLGAKEGIGHLPTAILDPSDLVLVPEPGYPVYVSGAIFAGGECHTMPLHARNGYLPVLDEIPHEVRRRAKLMWLNYPNNPTAAMATLEFFAEAVSFAREHDLLIAQDAAYAELYYADPPPSILQVEGARDVAVEFHSLSKTFNMTGWRVAFAVGNRDALAALATVKSNLDSGVFGAVQHAAIAALAGIDRPEIKAQIDAYRSRRDALVAGLLSAGWAVDLPEATIYVWARCPGGLDSLTVATRLLDEADVVVIPGAGFGPAGEGFVRFALTVPEERTREAVQRIGGIRW